MLEIDVGARSAAAPQFVAETAEGRAREAEKPVPS
jgi:hypothetical protein